VNRDILVLGEGFIGGLLHRELGCGISGAQIKTFRDAERALEKYRPKIVINCVSVTGKRNVDDCELEKDATLLANSFVPVMLAEACLRRRIKLVHISSGCIFDFERKKDKPLKEESKNYYFKLFYSRSKIYAEEPLEALSGRYNILIVRIRIPLLNESHPGNILDKLIKYRKIIDVPNSVTYLPDFVRALKHLIKIDARGVYNVVNKGGLRYPELMKVYRRHVPGPGFEVVPMGKIGLTRTNLLLSASKLEKTGFKVREIHSVLEECVRGYVNSLHKGTKNN
jgi:3,5-epimerase/4-reductase